MYLDEDEITDDIMFWYHQKIKKDRWDWTSAERYMHLAEVRSNEKMLKRIIDAYWRENIPL